MKSWKKQISVHKFLRIAKNPNSIKVRGLYSAAPHIPEVEQSLEAYKMGDFLYMFRKCKNQQGNNLKTYFVKYNMKCRRVNDEWVMSGGRE